MSMLVAVAYDTEERAAEVLRVLRDLEDEQFLDLEDAICATKDHAGQIRLHQSEQRIAPGARKRAVSGALVGMLITVPLLAVGPAGALIGVAASGIAGVTAGIRGGVPEDTGVDDDFAMRLTRHNPPGSSTLFVLVRRSEPDQVLARVRAYGGTVLHTTLSPAAERRLKAALAEQEGAS